MPPASTRAIPSRPPGRSHVWYEPAVPRKVLFIAYLFPPIAGGGVHRSVAFVRHLRAFGWEPVVVCAGPGADSWVEDPSLLEHIPPGVEVHRVSNRVLGTAVRTIRRLARGPLRAVADAVLAVPDRQVSWGPGAWRAGRRRLAQGDIEAIYSTGAPWTDHLVAQVLKREFRLPWVADFRDPWTLFEMYRPVTRWHEAFDRRLEGGIYRDADRIISNTPESLADLVTSFPAAKPKAICIPNGFEESDFTHLPEPKPVPPLTIGYAGSFYPGRGPEDFYRLLDGALGHHPDLRTKLRILLMGRTEQAPSVAGTRIEGLTTALGYLPRDQALKTLAECTLSLIVMPRSRDGSTRVVPGKLYEALRLGRPILAVTPPGGAADLVREAGGDSLVLDPLDPEGAPRLAEWLTQLAARGPKGRMNPELVRKYDRRVLTERLAATLDTLVL